MLRKKTLLCLVLKLAIARKAAAESPTAALTRCAVDAVPAGTVCLDKFEENAFTVDRNRCTQRVRVGARSFDMVGNLEEWVADWVPLSSVCPGWGGFSDDEMCLSGASTTETGPGALLRGGSFVVSGSASRFGNISRVESWVGLLASLTRTWRCSPSRVRSPRTRTSR